jgi:uncharacterized protein
VEWWEFFHRLALTPEEREEDSEVIAAARLASVDPITKQSNGYRYRFDASQPLKLSARGGFHPRFALVPLRSDGDRLVPLPHLLKGKSMALDLEGVLDEQHPDQVTIKLSHKLLAQLKEAGLPGGDLPRQADLIPLPKQIYKRMLEHLVRLAQGWVFDRTVLTAALLHLLERRPIPELVVINRRIRQEAGAARFTAPDRQLIEADRDLQPVQPHVQQFRRRSRTPQHRPRGRDQQTEQQGPDPWEAPGRVP